MKKKIIYIILLAFLSYTAYSCTFTVNLNDTYGDGWNGNSITIQVNGTAVLSNITVSMMM